MTAPYETALSAAQNGDFLQASSLCKGILSTSPDHFDALHLLGVLHTLEGQANAALPLLEKAVALNPNSAKFHTSLGNACKETGRSAAAERHYRQALGLDHMHFDARHNLAVLLVEQGRNQEAEAHFRQALAQQPQHPELSSHLGHVLLNDQRAAEALPLLQTGIAASPNTLLPWLDLGLCLHELGQHEAALSPLRQAFTLAPQRAEPHRALGSVLVALGCYPEARDAYRQALAAAPNHIETHATFAWLLERSNDLDAAHAITQTGLKLAPEHPLLRLVAAKLARRQNRLDEAYTLLDGLDALAPSAKIAAGLHHERGVLCDRLDRTAEAYTEFQRAKLSQQQAENADEKEADDYFFMLDELAAFDLAPAHSPSLALPDNTEPDPVFIVGFPRSGTTLLDQILDSHPVLQVIEEQPLIQNLAGRIGDVYPNQPDALWRLTRDQLAELRAAYYTEARQHLDLKPGEILVDKHPLNLIRLPIIWRLFPHARILLALRHPCDACLSGFMQLFERNDAMACFDTLENAARLYDKVMGLWHRYSGTLPLNWHPVIYESLVADFDGETRAVLDFLGLPWDNNLRDFYRHAKERGNINTPSYHQVAQPIYQRAVGRWQRYAPQFAEALPLLAPHIAWIESLSAHQVAT